MRNAREVVVGRYFKGERREAITRAFAFRIDSVGSDVATQRGCGGEQAKSRAKTSQTGGFAGLFAAHLGLL